MTTGPAFAAFAPAAPFAMSDPTAEPCRDPEVLDRIRRLAVPPAWTDVWICPLANGHVQASGRDARGRKQYRYHPHWRETRDATKYHRMIAFGSTLPAVRARIETDLARPGLPRAKVLAAVVRLLETTLIRVGNEEYARANGSFGLTTLRDRHVQVNGAAVRLPFPRQERRSPCRGRERPPPGPPHSPVSGSARI